MHSFRAYMSLYSELTDEDWNKIQSCLTRRIIQQNRILLKQGAICKNLYFLENGSIRYFTKKNNKELTNYLLQPPFLFTSAQSFTQQIPSEESIQAVDESCLWVITREDAYKLLKIPLWNDFISSL